MHHFLKAIGLRHLSINEIVKKHYFNKNFEYLDLLTEHFHSFDDVPWNRLDVIERYMNSDRNNYFILTTRDPDAWFKSAVSFGKQLGRKVPSEDERNEYIEQTLHRHNQSCRELAALHGKKLLEIDVTSEEDAAAKITSFLGISNRNIPFPHSNKTKPEFRT